MIAYKALFSALLSRLTALACSSTWVTSFIAFVLVCFLNIHRSGVLTALAWLVRRETAAISAHVVCTPYNHAPCPFMQSHIHKVYACLAVTCHLHFGQNDRDLLRAPAVTRGCTFAGISNQWPKNTSVVSKKKKKRKKKKRICVASKCDLPPQYELHNTVRRFWDVYINRR